MKRIFMVAIVVTLFFVVILPVAIAGICGLFPHKGQGEILSNTNITKEPMPDKIKVYMTKTEKIVEVDFEEYVKCVMVSEMPASFETEALKAQAVAARSYSLSRVKRFTDTGGTDHSGAPVCDDVHCQVYRPKEEIENLKGEEWMKEYWSKIEDVMKSTEGQVMYYDGVLAEQALFHSSSGGRTENSEDVFVSAVPYLRSVDSSEYEKEAPHTGEQITFSMEEFASKIKNTYGNPGNISSDNIKILSNSQGGSVDDVQVGSITTTGRKLRTLLGLRSATFSISFADSSIIFTTSGYGHGVGMSQYGANGMAKDGKNHVEILKYYYTGVEVQ